MTVTTKKKLVRDASVATSSLAVVGLAVGFLISPTNSALAVSLESVAQGPKGVQTLYGSLTNAQGKPAWGTRIFITHKVRNHTVVDAYAIADRLGAYRIVMRKPNRVYQIQAAQLVGKTWVVTKKQVQLNAGYSYKLSGKIVQKGVFTLLPISTY